MTDKLYIFLLNQNYEIIEKTNMERPKSLGELYKKIKISLPSLPKLKSHFELFYLSKSSDIEIKQKIICNIDDFKSIDDYLLIRIIEENNLNDSIVSFYNQLPDDTKDILDEKYACCICLKIIKNENPYFCYSCQHIFHKNCLEKQRDKTIGEIFKCPTCNNELPLENWKAKLDHEDNIAREASYLKQTKSQFFIDFLNTIYKNIINESKKELNEYKLKTSEILLDLLFKTNEIKSILKEQLNKKLIEVVRKLKVLENNITSFCEYRNEINLQYTTKESGVYNIFGKNFVENNKDNIELVINDKNSKLISQYQLKEGVNKIKLVMKKRLNNLEYMFYDCNTLSNIEELKYLDTKEVTNFSYMFFGCTALSSNKQSEKLIKPLEKWNISKGINFYNMFSDNKLLLELKSFKKTETNDHFLNDTEFFSESKLNTNINIEILKNNL